MMPFPEKHHIYAIYLYEEKDPRIDVWLSPRICMNGQQDCNFLEIIQLITVALCLYKIIQV